MSIAAGYGQQLLLEQQGSHSSAFLQNRPQRVPRVQTNAQVCQAATRTPATSSPAGASNGAKRVVLTVPSQNHQLWLPANINGVVDAKLSQAELANNAVPRLVSTADRSQDKQGTSNGAASAEAAPSGTANGASSRKHTSGSAGQAGAAGSSSNGWKRQDKQQKKHTAAPGQGSSQGDRSSTPPADTAASSKLLGCSTAKQVAACLRTLPEGFQLSTSSIAHAVLITSSSLKQVPVAGPKHKQLSGLLQQLCQLAEQSAAPDTGLVGPQDLLLNWLELANPAGKSSSSSSSSSSSPEAGSTQEDSSPGSSRSHSNAVFLIQQLPAVLMSLSAGQERAAFEGSSSSDSAAAPAAAAAAAAAAAPAASHHPPAARLLAILAITQHLACTHGIRLSSKHLAPVLSAAQASLLSFTFQQLLHLSCATHQLLGRSGFTAGKPHTPAHANSSSSSSRSSRSNTSSGSMDGPRQHELLPGLTAALEAKKPASVGPNDALQLLWCAARMVRPSSLLDKVPGSSEATPFSVLPRSWASQQLVNMACWAPEGYLAGARARVLVQCFTVASASGQRVPQAWCRAVLQALVPSARHLKLPQMAKLLRSCVLQHSVVPLQLLAACGELLVQQANSSRPDHLLVAIWAYACVGGQLRGHQWRSIEPAVQAAMGSSRPWALSRLCWALAKLHVTLGKGTTQQFWDVSVQHMDSLMLHHRDNQQRSMRYHQERSSSPDQSVDEEQMAQHVSYLHTRISNKAQHLKPQHLMQYLQLASSLLAPPPATWLRAACSTLDAFVEARFMTVDTLASALVALSHIKQVHNGSLAAALAGYNGRSSGSGGGSGRTGAAAVEVARWAAPVVASCEEHLHRLRSSKLIAGLLSAASQLGVQPPRSWMEAWCEASMPLLHGMSLQQLAASVQSLSMMGYTPGEAWLQEFYLASVQHVSRGQEEGSAGAAVSDAAASGGPADMLEAVVSTPAAAEASVQQEQAAAGAAAAAEGPEAGAGAMATAAAWTPGSISTYHIRPLCRMLRAVAMLGQQPEGTMAWGSTIMQHLQPGLHQLHPTQLAMAFKSAATLQLPLDDSWALGLEQALVQHMLQSLEGAEGELQEQHGSTAWTAAAAAAGVASDAAMPLLQVHTNGSSAGRHLEHVSPTQHATASAASASASPPAGGVAAPAGAHSDSAEVSTGTTGTSSSSTTTSSSDAAEPGSPTQRGHESHMHLRRKGAPLRLKVFGRLQPGAQKLVKPTRRVVSLQQHAAQPEEQALAPVLPAAPSKVQLLDLKEQLLQLQHSYEQNQHQHQHQPAPHERHAAAQASSSAQAAPQPPSKAAAVALQADNIVDVVWAVGRMGLKPRQQLWDVLLRYMVQRQLFRQCSAVSLTHMLWGLAKAGAQVEPATLQLLCSYLAASMQQLDAQAVVNMAYSLLELDFLADQKCMGALLQRSEQLMCAFGPQGLSNLLYALSMQNAKLSPRWLEAYCDAAAACMDSFSVKALTQQVMWGLGKQQATPSEHFIQALTAVLPAKVDDIPPLGVCNTIWALSSFSTPPPRELLLPLADRLSAVVHECDHSHLAVAVWGIAQLRDRLVDAEWLDTIYDQMAASVHQQPGKVLVDMLYALVALDFRLSEAKMQQLFDALEARAQELEPGHVVTCVLCFARMEQPPSDAVLEVFLQRVRALLCSFSGEEVGLLMNALVKAGADPSDEWLCDFCRVTQLRLPRFGPRALARTLWSFSMFQYVPTRSWLQAFLLQSRRHMRSFNCHELALVGMAVVLLSVRPSSAWVAAFQDRVIRLSGRFGAQDHANILWALEQLGK